MAAAAASDAVAASVDIFGGFASLHPATNDDDDDDEDTQAGNIVLNVFPHPTNSNMWVCDSLCCVFDMPFFGFFGAYFLVFFSGDFRGGPGGPQGGPQGGVF